MPRLQAVRGWRWLLTCAALLAVTPAGADALRCGSRLVTEGDSQAKVRGLCGEPTEINQREILRRPIVWIRGRPYLASREPQPVLVEFWTYNFGPYRLMRRIRFDDGIVKEIETLGHGYNEPP